MSDASRITVVADGVRYVAAPDDAVLAGVRTGAIVRGRLVDEITGAPVSAPITIVPAGLAFASPRTRAAVNPRSADGGLVGLVGVPTRALPRLRVVTYEVGLEVRAAGYVPRTSLRAFGPIGAFPGTFAPADLGDVAMHREPVMLFGRAVVRGPAGDAPLPNATISNAGVWRTAPTLTVVPPPANPDLAFVDPPLYGARLATTNLRAVTLTPDAPNPKTLLRPAAAGATAVTISDRVALGATPLLGIDEGDPDRAEWVMVTSLVGAASPAQPAVATLAYPLARDHRAGAPAHGTTIGAPTAARTVSVDAIPGDVTLFTSPIGAFAAGTVEVDDGVAAPEYHRLARYEFVTDADGQWRLPPLSRVAQVVVAGAHATKSMPPRTVTAEYPRREQRLDLVFS